MSQHKIDFREGHRTDSALGPLLPVLLILELNISLLVYEGKSALSFSIDSLLSDFSLIFSKEVLSFKGLCVDVLPSNRLASNDRFLGSARVIDQETSSPP